MKRLLACLALCASLSASAQDDNCTMLGVQDLSSAYLNLSNSLDSVKTALNQIVSQLDSIDNLALPIVNGISTPHGQVNCTEDGHFIVPNGVSQLEVVVSGGKGGSGGSTVPPYNNNQNGCAFGGVGGGGGGNGGYFRGLLSVSPGDTLVFSIGQNGINGTTGTSWNANGSAGTAGTETSVLFGGNHVLIASGGGGGQGACCYQCCGNTTPGNCGTNNMNGASGSNGSAAPLADFATSGFITLDQGVSGSGAGVTIRY